MRFRKRTSLGGSGPSSISQNGIPCAVGSWWWLSREEPHCWHMAPQHGSSSSSSVAAAGLSRAMGLAICVAGFTVTPRPLSCWNRRPGCSRVCRRLYSASRFCEMVQTQRS
jgi:hypothetical protein